MTSYACIVCGSPARAPELSIGERQILRCTTCGLRTLDPMPTEVELEQFEDGSEYKAAFDFRDAIVARHDRTLRDLEHVVSRGRLLDVGSGPGFLLEVARDRGWDAEGVDPSSVAVDQARSLGFTAHHGMLEDLDLEPGSYDALALLQVVEHLPAPRPLLDACRRLLKPGGALLVATPNPASLLARAKRERFNYWIPPIHCVWYTPGALSRLLTDAGFRAVHRSTWSARTYGLNDGRDIVASRFPSVPQRAQNVLGRAVAAVADATGRGTIVEQIAVKVSP